MVDSSYETEDTSSMAVVTMNPSDEITFIFGADISLEEIDVYTKINNNHNLERQITFSLLSEKDAVVGENFMARIQERLNDHISCEREEKDDLVILYCDNPGRQYAADVGADGMVSRRQ